MYASVRHVAPEWCCDPTTRRCLRRCQLAEGRQHSGKCVCMWEPLPTRCQQIVTNDIRDEAERLLVRKSKPHESGGADMWIFGAKRILEHVVEPCPGFEDVLGRATDQHMRAREHPWRHLEDFGEIVPGDHPKAQSDKKTIAHGLKFKQLGEESFENMVG